PMPKQAFPNEGRSHRQGGPRSTPSSMQGDRIQDRNTHASFQEDVFDEIGLVDLRALGGDLGQVPSGCRGKPTDPLVGIEDTMTLENAVDGSQRRNRLDLRAGQGDQAAFCRLCSIFAQVTLRSQLLAEGENTLLDARRCLSGLLMGSMGAI